LRSVPVKTYFILVCLLITANGYLFSQAGDTLTKTAPKAFLDDKVDYHADDSMITDITNQKAFLYNNAVVIYQDMTLKAGYIEIDFKNNIVYAYGTKDSTGKDVQRPDFKNKDGQYVAGYIAYNFDTKKGKIRDVITQQDEGFIHGSVIKKDTNDVYYVKDGKYTTCDLEHPHYYIGAKKIKVIPNDKIITGPAELWIADIPTPLVLPFGYFPNKKGRRSGILIPSYGESTQWGFFLKDGGFYFGGNEFVDLALTGDIYSNGSFGGTANTNYRKRYRFDGGLNVNYSRNLNGDIELPNTIVENNFFVRWRHSQDPKAHPSSRFSADVNAGSSKYNKYNGNVTGDYLQSNFLSNISYSKTFTGTPFNFSANARHNQNTITKKMEITLPELSLTMNRIYPFKNRNRVTNTWHDKLGVSATANARNDISTTDSTLFTHQTLEQMRNGMHFTVPISTSFNILKYLTLTPVATASSSVYFQKIDKHYDRETNTVVTDTIPQTVMANDFSLSAGLSTRLYGDYFFKTKHLKQIRHVATPTLSASYRPDFSESKYGYYKTVPLDSLAATTSQYSIFQNGIYGAPPPGRSGLVSFSLNNTIDAKTKQQSDSGAVYKKVALIDNLGVSFAYNMAVKNYNWSDINLTGRTKLFKVMDVNASSTLTPYQIDSSGQRIERFEWNNGRVGRLTNMSVSFSTSLRSKEKTGTQPVSTTATQDQLDYINTHPEAYVDFNVPWNFSVFYNIDYRRPGLPKSEVTTQSLTFNGDLSLTKKWKISVTSGYDFTNKQVTLTSINVYRDLHCWEMRFNWVPFGFRQSFSVDINVKASVLKDLKLSRRKDWQDYQ
jgi:lipopolysaccharide assembly outer membrane protein LptD (OstA)